MHDKIQLNAGAKVHEFVDECVDSFIVWDILLFFHNNPGALEDTESLSNRLGRNQQDVSASLAALADKGILLTVDNNHYQPNPDPMHLNRIKAFNDALTVASTRLLILQQVLSKGRSKLARDAESGN